SATGTRPFDAGAAGFVMGEGAALFVLKRLSDAEKSGDRIYAVLLGLGGSSDGKGKGITAPNPVGQRLAVERAWANAHLNPAEAGYVEAHGTSTRVGDATELASLTEVFVKAGAAPGTIALGSVKSNIGHLKAAAGTGGLFKMVRSLHDKVLPPSLHFDVPNSGPSWSRCARARPGPLPRTGPCPAHPSVSPSTTATRPGWPRRRVELPTRCARATPRCGGCCARRACSSAAGRRRRWRSCTR